MEIVFESNHEFEKGKCSCDDKLAESLFYCLYDFFEKQYKQYEVFLSNAKKLPKSSLFCKIIRELVRQGDKPVYEKHEIPYDLKDKIQKNHIDGNMRVMIEENFDDNYEIIENTLNILSEEEVSSRQSFLKVMRDYYFEYLNEHHISFDDEEKVQEKAIDIFNWVKAKVCSKVECSEDESCCDEEVPVYAFSLVAYAFYKCRILLKVDGEK